ncbi:MAG TPA: hypothetical protein VIN09_12780, partial [Chloroflexota bacterium]
MTSSGNRLARWVLPRQPSARRLGLRGLLAALLLVVLMANGSRQASAGVGAWTPMDLDNLRVNAVAVDPTNPSIVYAGTNGQGVFRSVDGGRTWSQINSGLQNVFVNDIVISPTDPSIVLVATGQGSLVGDPNAGVYRSTNRGDSWTGRLVGPFVADLDISPQNPQLLYAAGAPPVFRSTDGGVTWEQAFSDASVFQSVDMQTVAINPSDANTVIVGGATEGGSGAVFRTTNGGQDWRLVAGLDMPFVTSVVFSPTNAQTAFFGNGQGVWRSQDAGATWSLVLSGPTVLSLLANQLNGDIVYVGTSDQGVFRTANGGATFHALNDGLGNLLVPALAIDRGRPQTLWAGTGDGAWSFTIAEPQPVRTWFFAEGSTAPPFDTWYLVQNPTTASATVTFTFQLEGGATTSRSVAV